MIQFLPVAILDQPGSNKAATSIECCPWVLDATDKAAVLYAILAVRLAVCPLLAALFLCSLASPGSMASLMPAGTIRGLCLHQALSPQQCWTFAAPGSATILRTTRLDVWLVGRCHDRLLRCNSLKCNFWTVSSSIYGSHDGWLYITAKPA